MTIKLTKELPTEAGRYFWVYENENGCKSKAEIVSLSFFGECENSSNLYIEHDDYESDAVSDVGGYWAKVDESMFEVVE